jgi:hypothetical protein
MPEIKALLAVLAHRCADQHPNGPLPPAAAGLRHISNADLDDILRGQRGAAAGAGRPRAYTLGRRSLPFQCPCAR